MKLFLTRGMFGEHLQQIGDETSNVKKILEHLFAWKHNDDIQRQYKIEPYDRFIFDDKSNRIAIDFGDYMTFMEVESVDEVQKSQFIGI